MGPAIREIAGPSAGDDNPGQDLQAPTAPANTLAVGSSSPMPSIEDHPAKVYIEFSLEKIVDALVNCPQR